MPITISKKEMAIQLEQYKKDNGCEHASQKCSSCLFGENNGCSLNLVINALEHNLGFDRETGKRQYRELLGVIK